MITVIVNKYPEIKTFSKNKILISDVDFYKAFNGEPLFGTVYDIEDLNQMIIDIKSYATENDIVIHTFNPLILNFFEDSDKDIFYYWSVNQSELKMFFEDEFNCKKLQVMGIGECICDTEISKLQWFL